MWWNLHTGVAKWCFWSYATPATALGQSTVLYLLGQEICKTEWKLNFKAAKKTSEKRTIWTRGKVSCYMDWESICLFTGFPSNRHFSAAYSRLREAKRRHISCSRGNSHLPKTWPFPPWGQTIRYWADRFRSIWSLIMTVFSWELIHTDILQKHNCLILKMGKTREFPGWFRNFLLTNWRHLSDCLRPRIRGPMKCKPRRFWHDPQVYAAKWASWNSNAILWAEKNTTHDDAFNSTRVSPKRGTLSCTDWPGYEGNFLSCELLFVLTLTQKNCFPKLHIEQTCMRFHKSYRWLFLHWTKGQTWNQKAVQKPGNYWHCKSPLVFIENLESIWYIIYVYGLSKNSSPQVALCGLRRRTVDKSSIRSDGWSDCMQVTSVKFKLKNHSD